MEYRFVLQTLIANGLVINLTLLSCSLGILFGSLVALCYLDKRFTYFLKRQVYLQLGFSTVLFALMIWMSSLQLFNPDFKRDSAALFTYVIYTAQGLVGILVVIYLFFEGKLLQTIVRK